MGTDRGDRHRFRRRVRRPGRRALSTPTLLACGALLLSGCASMPGSGDVRRVDSSPRSDADAQVRVYGVSPGKGEQPAELVSGFLEATTSDEENFGTAKEYLTKSAAKRWQPFAATTVLEQAPDVRVETDPGDRDGNGKTVVLSGKRIAVVDDTHAYKPDEQPYEERIHLTLSGSEWRIDGPPRGLILGESDFQRIYRSVNKYYFADPGPDAEESKVANHVLVADPVYVRRRIDPVTATVKALLDGPTGWLEPVVSSSFPSGTALGSRGERLSLDDSKALKVRLSDRAAGVSGARCARMAAQTLFTVQDLGEGSSQVSGVRLERQNGSELCALSRDAARAYAPEGVEGHPLHQYFVDSQHRMVRLTDDEDRPQPVPGPFGADDAGLGLVAVSRDERHAAGVTADGQSLYVTELASDAERGKVRLRSQGGSVAHGLTAPSWDGLGGLWVADRDPQRPRLLRLRDGTGPVDEVELPKLGGGRITALRVSADGSRIAMLVERSGHSTLRLGRIERRGTAADPKLSVRALQAIAPKLEDVDTFSWAGDSRLVVAGRESDGVQQLQYVETDGSPANVPEVPGPNGVQSIGASEDQTRPLIAETRENGIVRLLPNTDWKTVDQDGTAPVYPG
ncbi:LpqB family beta-propeller domain-containing protein [Streptomyces luomodiensis]|uniref:LpqB family beta-propeller domain-containing protein n=1 Tax=Streptomyces luomodiensis TaxID=3026192 RepID=A0ABY9UWM0_9ACTN|nr:LpqB family beta-propeller domain-containing protein [Streptomyces sp. SCA4-21]WNE96962.1 LpqB family beta-propeller domain-containing protein [Streptomyces sp. SCA4-21]